MTENQSLKTSMSQSSMVTSFSCVGIFNTTLLQICCWM